MHAGDRRVARTNLAEVGYKNGFALGAQERHVLDLFEHLCPAFATVRNLEMHDLAASVQVLGIAPGRCDDLARLNILVAHVDDRHNDRHLAQIGLDHVIGVVATNTGAVEQQIEQ